MKNSKQLLEARGALVEELETILDTVARRNVISPKWKTRAKTPSTVRWRNSMTRSNAPKTMRPCSPPPQGRP